MVNKNFPLAAFSIVSIICLSACSCIINRSEASEEIHQDKANKLTVEAQKAVGEYYSKKFVQCENDRFFTRYAHGEGKTYLEVRGLSNNYKIVARALLSADKYNEIEWKGEGISACSALRLCELPYGCNEYSDCTDDFLKVYIEKRINKPWEVVPISPPYKLAAPTCEETKAHPIWKKPS